MSSQAVRLVLIFLGGAGLGSLVNWAIYALAWSPRPISPWSPAPDERRPRTWADRIPVFGWLRLRREVDLFGPGFWLRPMFLEVFFGLALAALYWWEIQQLGLVRDQAPLGIIPPIGPLYSEYFSHVLLACLMLAASVIDIDEKIVPDEITVPGTVLGLLLATLVPASLLPDVAERVVNPVVGAPLMNRAGAPALGMTGSPLWLEPVTPLSPNEWPPSWADPSGWRSLGIALAIYFFWCFALAPRIWRGRRGAMFALRLIMARVLRELARPPLRWFLVGGALWILGTWFVAQQWPLVGEAAWCGLVTSLVGLLGGGGIVWAVRLIGSAALRREAMGFGDVTLMMMVGTFVGWQACLVTFFLSPFAAVVVGLVQLIMRRDNVLPFVPYLCLGATATIVWWAKIWNWAEQMFVFPTLVPAVVVICLTLLGMMLTVWRVIKSLLFHDEV